MIIPVHHNPFFRGADDFIVNVVDYAGLVCVGHNLPLRVRPAVDCFLDCLLCGFGLFLYVGDLGFRRCFAPGHRFLCLPDDTLFAFQHNPADESTDRQS